MSRGPYSAAQVAVLYRVTIHTVHRWAAAGRLGAHKVAGPSGYEWRFSRALVDEATGGADTPGGDPTPARTVMDAVHAIEEMVGLR